MSSAETDPFLEVAELQILETIDERRRGLSDALASDSLEALLRPSYEDADSKLAVRAEGIATNPALQDTLADIGSRAVGGLMQIEPLRGIMPDEEIARLEEILHGRVERVGAFFDKYGAVTDQALRVKAFVAGGMATASEVAVEQIGADGALDNGSEVDGDPADTEQSQAIKFTAKVVAKGLIIGDTLIANSRLGTNKDQKARLLSYVAGLDPDSEKTLKDLFEVAYGTDMTYQADKTRAIVAALNEYVLEATGQEIILNNDKMTTARRYFKNPDLEIDIGSKHPEWAKAGAVEVVARRRLKVILHEDGIQFGRSDKRFKYNLRNRPEDIDFTEQRIKALGLIVSNGRISASDLWSQINDEHGQPLSDNQSRVSTVRRWMLGLSLDRKAIIEYNGGKGGSSYYELSDRFSGVDFVLGKDVGEESTVRSSYEAILLPQALAEAKKKDELTARDAYVIVKQLHKFNVILKDCGLPVVTQELLDSFSEEDISDYSELSGDGNTIEEIRISATDKLRSLLGDDEALGKFISSAKEDDPIYKFVEYLTEMAGDEGLEIINLLIRARFCNDGRWASTEGELAKKLSIVVVDEHDRIIWPIAYNNVGLTKITEIEDERYARGESAQKRTLFVSGMGGIDRARSSGKPESEGQSASSEDEQTESETIKALKEFAREVAKEFTSGLDPRGKYKMRVIGQYVPRFNPTAVRKLIQLKGGDKASERDDIHVREYDLEEVIKILAFNNKNHKNTLGIKSKEREVNRAINRVIFRAQKAYDRAKREAAESRAD